MSRDNAPNISQADPRAFELGRTMQSLKYSKELVRIGHIEADSVVAHEKHVLTRGGVLAPCDRDAWLLSLAGIFDGVIQQIRPNLAQQSCVRHDFWQLL